MFLGLSMIYIWKAGRLYQHQVNSSLTFIKHRALWQTENLTSACSWSSLLFLESLISPLFSLIKPIILCRSPCRCLRGCLFKGAVPRGLQYLYLFTKQYINQFLKEEQIMVCFSKLWKGPQAVMLLVYVGSARDIICQKMNKHTITINCKSRSDYANKLILRDTSDEF